MKRLAEILRRAAASLNAEADRLDPPVPLRFGELQQESLGDALAREAREQFFTPEFKREISAAIEIGYGDRPTRFTRKLHAIRGGRA